MTRFAFTPLARALTALTFGAVSAAAQSTTTLLDLNFNSAATFPSYASPAVTGVGGTTSTVLPGDAGFNSGLFPTAPTSGYVALTPNASAVTPTTFFGGWAANVTLATVNSLYTAGGFGQADLSKVSFTARVRARGMPANGGVVILELRGSGDNPNAPISGYKRIRFEPVFLAGNDWVTIGGTLNTAGLQAAQGSIYAFPTNAAQYTALVEINGFNQFGTTGYVAYNTPTGTSNGGRKNPGFGFTGGIRVEVDDVKLIVTDAATTGYLASTTPAQLLRNGNFNNGDANWTFFEGAYASNQGFNEDGSIFALIPGFGGTPVAGFMQNNVAFNPANGDFFTATFRAKFEANYRADQTIVAFMDGSGVTTFLEVDLTNDIAPRLGSWHTYTATFRATPAQLAAMNGNMSLKIQPLGRTANGTPFSSAIIDDVVLAQASASAVGPQITVRVAGGSRSDGENATLYPPLVGRTTPYALQLANQGAENLVISGVSLTGTGFVLSDPATPITIVPGAVANLAFTASPTSLGSLAGVLTITSNDRDTADQSFVVNLAANAVLPSDTFDGGESAATLGWLSAASSTNLATNSSLTTSGGALNLAVDSSNDDYPWFYIGSKVFASPGPLDLSTSSLLVSLRAVGKFVESPSNKVQLRLESLNAAGTVTGRIELGQPVDETTAGAVPGAFPAYFAPDGINDRVAVLLPEGGSYTTVGGSLASTGVNTTFDVNAPAYRLVVHMTDFEFDLDAGNLVQIDAITLNLGARSFSILNGGFEADASDPGPAAPPAGWSQFPAEGVSKNLVINGDALYNAALAGPDPTATFTAFSGSRAIKVYGQNFYVGGTWQGPSQTGTLLQSFRLADTAGLETGLALHARAAARVYSVDPLTGGSTFRFGFKYLDAAANEIGRDVTTITAGSAKLDTWVALVANGTIPTGADRVELITEFVQNASTDAGAVYLDDISVGLGQVATTASFGGVTYELVWSDEFDGTSLNSGSWTPELGNGVGGWGNNEVQNYTTDPQNLRVEDGRLVIQAIKTGNTWTSARIKTQDKREFLHGKMEFRAKLPVGVGPWPAAWMLGANFDQVGWPACGEIDVLEWSGVQPGVVGQATHSPSRFGANAIEVKTPVANLATQFHTYAVVWEPGRVTFSIDGITTGTWTTADTGNPFEKEFFLLLNLAIGGNYVGNQIDPNLTSATYEVDYVRVYQAPASVPLTPYQTYLQSRGLATDLALDADADGDGVPEGVRFAFGAAAPSLGSSPASFQRSGNDAFTYTFDFRTASGLVATPEISTDLVSWSVPADYQLTDIAGAGAGYQRKALTVAHAPATRIFVRLRLTAE